MLLLLLFWLEFLFGVWFAKADFLTLKNEIMQEIKERFDAEGIEIPFPHRTLYTGAATSPMPIRIVNDEMSVSHGSGQPVDGAGDRTNAERLT